AECEDAKQRRLATEHAHFRIQEMSLTEPYGRCPRWGLETHDRRTAARFERGQKVGDGDAGYLAAQCRSSVGTACFSGLHSSRLLGIERTFILPDSAVKAWLREEGLGLGSASGRNGRFSKRSGWFFARKS